MLLHGLREGAEDDAGLGQLLFEGGRYRNAIEDGVDGDAGQSRPLMQRDPELVIGFEQLGVNLIQALGPILV